MPFTWKGVLLIILSSYLTAKCAYDQPTRSRAFFAFILGLYGLGFIAIVFQFIDAGMLYN